ncbi:hypothetical protein TNCV_4658611 [Trichonephila clavipes]|nr:hypothetical protein TNCV_4658611 [Trichonephila clavipes]
MIIRTWDLNAKPFHLISEISNRVIGVSEISDSRFIDATTYYVRCPQACEFSSLEEGIRVVQHYSRSPPRSTPERHFSRT